MSTCIVKDDVACDNIGFHYSDFSRRFYTADLKVVTLIEIDAILSVCLDTAPYTKIDRGNGVLGPIHHFNG